MMKSRQVEPSRIYFNSGNPALLNLLAERYQRVLDIGCGAGDNAAIVKSKGVDCQVYTLFQS